MLLPVIVVFCAFMVHSLMALSSFYDVALSGFEQVYLEASRDISDRSCILQIASEEIDQVGDSAIWSHVTFTQSSLRGFGVGDGGVEDWSRLVDKDSNSAIDVAEYSPSLELRLVFPFDPDIVCLAIVEGPGIFTVLSFRLSVVRVILQNSIGKESGRLKEGLFENYLHGAIVPEREFQVKVF